MYYNKKGESIELEEWGKLLGDFEYKIIKQETLPDGKWVSTVWLGLDHRFENDGGAPLIFETMVFESQTGRGDLDMDRYSTEEEARAGHEWMVKKYTA